ncbi:MAG: DnaD domain protein [Anaerolineales bacterium]|nr:DnaD domain protein [Anaerolineales bacterium]
MNKFQGFTGSETFTQVPDSFFRKLLNEIDDLAELKVTLYAFWRIEQMEGGARFLCRTEFAEDADFMRGLGAAELDAALEKAVRRGSLLKASPRGEDRGAESEAGDFYFLNTPRGRAAVESMQKGDWRAAMRPLSAHSLSPERPNIFKLYEENIGPLTPLIADALRDAEATYPAEWIEEAVGEAVKRNKRNWKYVEAILKRWKVEGHVQKQDQRDAREDSRRYSEGEFAAYLKRD